MKPTPYILAAAAALGVALASCDDNESYSDMLRDEEHACNWYLAQQNVVPYVPADSVFTTLADVMDANPGLSREEALKKVPFYRMDEDGYLYMQVVNPGNEKNRAQEGDRVYFRFNMRNINYLSQGIDAPLEGNSDNVTASNTSFVMGNTTLSSSTQWGTGIQEPLKYLGYDSEVNLVVRSYYGFLQYQSQCQAFVMNVRYFKAEY